MYLSELKLSRCVQLISDSVCSERLEDYMGLHSCQELGQNDRFESVTLSVRQFAASLKHIHKTLCFNRLTLRVTHSVRQFATSLKHIHKTHCFNIVSLRVTHSVWQFVASFKHIHKTHRLWQFSASFKLIHKSNCFNISLL